MKSRHSFCIVFSKLKLKPLFVTRFTLLHTYPHLCSYTSDQVTNTPKIKWFLSKGCKFLKKLWCCVVEKVKQVLTIELKT